MVHLSQGLNGHQSKMSSSKKLICTGTLRQVFNRVYRLEILSVMLVFRITSVNCCPSTFSLVQLSPPPPCPVWLNCKNVQCTGGIWSSAQRQISTVRKVPLKFSFDDNILHYLLWVLSFYNRSATVLLSCIKNTTLYGAGQFWCGQIHFEGPPLPVGPE